MTTNLKFVQAQTFTLAGSGVSQGDTTLTLVSFNGINGVALTMSNFGTIGYGTCEPSSGRNEEQISFTGITPNMDGTVTLTGIKSVLNISPYTETSSFSQGHPGATTFIISNTAGFYNTFANKENDEDITGVTWLVDDPTVSRQIANKEYVDGIAIAGSPPASEVLPGISMEATQAEVNAGTQSRVYMGTPYELFVNPAKLTTSALVGAINLTAGENITAGQTIAINPSDGFAYLASSLSSTSYRATNYIGIATNTVTTGNTVKVQQYSGIITGLSLGAQTGTVTSTIDNSQTDTTATLSVSVDSSGGGTNSPGQAFITGNIVANITKIDVYFAAHAGTVTGNVTLTLYPVTGFAGTLVTLGSSLGAVTVTQASITDNAYTTFTFASPITLSPNTYYAYQLTGTAANASNAVIVPLSASPTFAAVGGGLSATGMGSLNTLSNNSYMAYKTYYTATRSYSIGDQAFLGDTNGSIVVTTPGTIRIPIGTIISSSSILFGKPSGEQPIGSFGMPVTPNVRAYAIPLSKNINKMILALSYTSTSGSPTTWSGTMVLSPSFSGITSVETGTSAANHSIFSYDFWNATVFAHAAMSTIVGTSVSGTLTVYFYK